MLQTGDSTNTDRGSFLIYGDLSKDEINPALEYTGAGALSVAKSGPNANGSHFFICVWIRIIGILDGCRMG